MGVQTILNPAPAAEIDKKIFPFVDYFIPNETEASFYESFSVETHDDAKAAAKLLDMGIKNVIITLVKKELILQMRMKVSFSNRELIGTCC